MEQKIKQAEDIARRMLAGEGIQEGGSKGIPTAADMRGFAQTRTMFDKRAMWRNIARRTRRHDHSHLWWVAAATVVVAIGAWLSLSERSFKGVEPQGLAVITLDDGREIALRSDTVLAVGGSRVAVSGGRVSQAAAGEKTEQITLRVPRGGQPLALDLSDGTTVWLNADSKLRYPSRFTEKRREVELSGEGFFEVARDESRPFAVRSGAVRTTALGTSFNVNAYDGSVRTTLVSGSVLVEVEGGASQVLVPSMQAVWDNGLIVRKVDTGVETAWRQGLMILSHTNLAEIMTTLSRWYDVDVEWATTDAAAHTFTGSLSRTDDLAAILEKLTLLGAPRFELKGNKVIIH